MLRNFRGDDKNEWSIQLEKLFRQEIKFIAGAANIKHLPRIFLSQIAFVGKSNVGKSSLINLVTARRSLARVSHTPGRTQQINFFDVAGRFILVDLPGYGYAKVSKAQQANWEKLITHYLFNSPSLKLINLLIDSRRGIKENDVAVMDLLSSKELNWQIIFTKVDEIKDREVLKIEALDFVKERYNKSVKIFFTSVKKKEGAKELQHCIMQFI